MTLEEFYKDVQNPFFIRMKSILDYRRQNVLTYISSTKDRPTNYIKCQKHHIIPKSWYRHHGYEIDDTQNNTIYLTPSEHLEIHVLMREYFKSVNDLDMYYAMALAIDKMSNGNIDWINKIVNDDKEKAFFLKTYEENLDNAAKATMYRYKQMTPEQRALLSKHISDGWKNMDKDAYDSLCSKRSTIGKKLWKDPSYKTGSEEWKQHQSESQKQAWANKSDIQKEIENQKRRETWKNMPEERKQQLRNEQVKIQTELWNAKSKDEKQKHGKKISNSYKNRSAESRALQKKRQSESRKKYLASLTEKEKQKMSLERRSRKWMSNDNLMISRMVHPNEIQQLLDDGWIFGNKSYWYKKLKLLTQSNI